MAWLILIVIGGIMLVFTYRAWSAWKTRFGHRNEDYDAARLMQLIQAEIPEAPPRPSSPAEALRIPPPQPLKAHATPEAPLAAPGTRLPVLDLAAQTLYLQLRAELAGYPLLCAVDIARLLPAHGTVPPRVQADFVICKKDFHPVVVILIERTPSDPMLTRAESLLRSHRLRVLRWSADALPDRETMREQIFKAKN